MEPDRSASANAERYFARSRKAKSRLTHAQRRLKEISSKQEHLSGLLNTALHTRDYKELRNIHDNLFGGKRSPAEAKLQVRRLPYHEHTSSSGRRILVGRGGKDNDALLKLARKEDIWLHAQGVPGSHIVIPGGKLSDTKTLHEAAYHAAKNSRHRTAKVAPVIYTLAKYVSKPRGAAPGAVRVMREKTLFVELS